MSHPAKAPRLGRTLLAAPAAVVLLLVLHQMLPRFGGASWCVVVRHVAACLETPSFG